MNDTVAARLGPFLLGRVLGEGASARVFEAREEDSGRVVALKAMRAELMQSEAARVHFHREARALMAMEHPNVVSIVDYSGADATEPFIAFEKLEGQTLAAAVEARGPMPLPVFASAFVQVLAGLSAVHAAQLLHRDLSIQNFFVEQNGRVVLTDFGLIAASDKRTSETFVTRGTGIIGTPLFLAPEILRGEGYSVQSDLYALGVAMTQALLGRKPFPTEDISALLGAILEGRLDQARSVRRDLPADVVAIIERARARDRKERPASCEEITRVLSPHAGDGDAMIEWLEGSAETRVHVQRSRDDEIRDALVTKRTGDALEIASGGRYKVEHELGSGGMGQVFLARDTKLKRKVAVKTLVADDPMSRRRFHREARALGRLRHPHIVRVYDYSGRDALLPYLVMDVVNGPTLDKVLDVQTLPETVVLLLALRLLDALAHAHGAGIVHRDVKPENVFIDERSSPVLADFGIARGLDGKSETFVSPKTQAIGTSTYASPEQIYEPDTVTGQSDLFSLGSTLYVLVESTDALPAGFDALAALNTQSRLTFHSEVSKKFADLIQQLRQKDPKQRGASAAAVREQVAAILGPQKVRDGAALLRQFFANETLPEALPPPARTRSRVLFAGAAALALCAAGVWWFLRPRPAQLTTAAPIEEAAPTRPSELPPPADPVALPPPVPDAAPDAAVVSARPAVRPVEPKPKSTEPARPEPAKIDTRPAMVRLVTKPWAKVTIDGRAYGETPEFRSTELVAGTHTFRFEHPGFSTVTRAVELKPGEQRDIVVTLSKP